MTRHTEYIVAVSDDPTTPVGSSVGLATRVITWIGCVERPDGTMGDFTAIRWDHVCPHCPREVAAYRGHDCPNTPAPEPPPEDPNQGTLFDRPTP